MESRSITIDDLLKVLGRFWKSIFAFTILAGVIAFTWVIVIPTKYRATTSLLVLAPNLSSASSAAAQLAVLNASAATPLRTIKGVVMSDRETQAIMDKFGIDWREFEHCFVVVDESQSNQLTISYDSTDKEKNLAILQYSIEKLKELDKEFNFTVGSRQAASLKDEVAKKETEVKKAEDNLLELQKTLKTVSDPTDPKTIAAYLEKYQKLELELGGVQAQIRILRNQASTAATNSSIPSSIPPAKTWQAKLSDIEYKLRVARTTMADQNPEVVRLKRQEQQTREQFQREVQKYLQSVNKNLDPTLAELESKRMLLEYQTEQARQLAKVAPEEGLKLARQVAEVLTLRKVLTALRAQYEQAKIESEVDRVRWSVLDPPHTEHKPLNKRYALVAAITMVITFILALMVGVFRLRKLESRAG